LKKVTVKVKKIKFTQDNKRKLDFGKKNFSKRKQKQNKKKMAGVPPANGKYLRERQNVDYREAKLNGGRPSAKRAGETIRKEVIQPPKIFKNAIPTSNEYALLTNTNEVIEMEQDEGAGSNNQQFRPVLNNKPRATSTPKKTKPIVLWNTNHGDLKKMAEELQLNCPFQKMKSKNAYQMFPSSKEEKQAIRDHLDSKAMQYHTYTEIEDRHSVFVLKNFELMDTTELVKTLQASKIPAKFATLISKKESNPVYRVSFEKNAVDINTLMTEHRFVDRLRVTWEKLAKAKQRPTQCRNCQAWGHSKINCKRQFRCHKCIEPHGPGECKRTAADAADPKKPPKCCNCGERHLSSNYGCPAYLKYAAKTMKLNRGQHTSSPRAFNSTPAPTNSTWAGAFKTTEDGFPPLGASTASTSRAASQAANRAHVLGKSQPVYANKPTFNSHSTQNDSNDFAQFTQLKSGFTAIAGFSEGMQILSQFQMHLQNFAGNPMAIAKFITLVTLLISSRTAKVLLKKALL
jgi:hypothetical protein